jgi:hypothetical protein
VHRALEIGKRREGLLDLHEHESTTTHLSPRLLTSAQRARSANH